MLTSVVAFVSLLVAGVSAQATFPPGFNPGAVESDQKNSWCDAQLVTCPLLCEDYARDNTCDPVRLSFSCTCSNGTAPDVASYMNTLPYFICHENFGQCIENHPNDADGQQECKNAQRLCGSLNATELDEARNPTTSSALPSQTPTGEEQQPSQTGGPEPTPTPTGNAGAPLQIAQDYSLGFLAAILLGVFGFLL